MKSKNAYAPQNIIRALRLPFSAASALAFIFGSLIEKNNFIFFNFLLGLITVMTVHLSANLINDYCDSRSGADWQDRNFYNFFGGSKLIQENVLPEIFYLGSAIIFGVISGISVILLSFRLKSFLAAGLYLIIIALSWLYSVRPFRFSYNRLGEVAIFFLFGPVPVMGGYFIQTGIFPDLKSFLLSLPFAFLTTGILFANEVPDLSADKKVSKFNLVSICGEKNAFFLYSIIMLSGFFSVYLGFRLGFLHPVSLFSLALIIPVIIAAGILKKYYLDKMLLIKSSQMTIAIQTIAGIILILDQIICIKL